MNKLRFLLKYLRYQLAAGNKHDVHSPFVFDLLTNVIEVNTPYYVYDKIEFLRTQLLASSKMIEVTDLGAGVSGKRKISDIAQRSAKPAKYGQLLFRMVNHFQPKNILELGTSLGISSLYLAGPSSEAKLVTVEGCPQIARAAGEHFKKFGATNIEVINGNFDEVLPGLNDKKFDFIFFDGNHRKEPTIKYFEMCLAMAGDNAVFVFDDIHWSAEMEQAWEYIKAHKGVSVTIDLFFLGFVFFRKEQVREHFVLKF